MKVSEEIQVPVGVAESLRRWLYDVLRMLTRAINRKADMDGSADIIIDSATKGLVLKDTQGTPHYWRLTVDNTGALVTTDLGTSKP